MLNKNALIRFFGTVITLYLCFLALIFLGEKSYYQSFLCSTNNFVLHKIMSNDSVRIFQNPAASNIRNDTKIIIADRQQIQQLKSQLKVKGQRQQSLDARNITFGSIRFGYLPTILVLALVLATPTRRRKAKIWSVLMGFFWVNIFITFKLYTWILQESISFQAYSFWGQKYWDTLYFTFVDDVPMRIIAPIFIWFLVAFRKKGWQAFLVKPSISSKESRL